MTRSHKRTPLAPLLAAEVRADLARGRVGIASVATRIGMRRATLSQRLNGHSPFTLAELDAVASVLGTTASELIARAETVREADEAAADAAGTTTPPTAPAVVDPDEHP